MLITRLLRGSKRSIGIGLPEISEGPRNLGGNWFAGEGRNRRLLASGCSRSFGVSLGSTMHRRRRVAESSNLGSHEMCSVSKLPTFGHRCSRFRGADPIAEWISAEGLQAGYRRLWANDPITACRAPHSTLAASAQSAERICSFRLTFRSLSHSP
jgi:hypothetical protein